MAASFQLRRQVVAVARSHRPLVVAIGDVYALRAEHELGALCPQPGQEVKRCWHVSTLGKDPGVEV